ncbi:MAG: CAP domain-containing protein [Candidatus Diapherotrites archaeon]|nr:CAP domain-containing protein [Candidatus Diapherotrites archaeon]
MSESDRQRITKRIDNNGKTLKLTLLNIVMSLRERRNTGGTIDFVSDGDESKTRLTEEEIKKIEDAYKRAKEREQQNENKTRNEVDSNECQYYSCKKTCNQTCKYCKRKFCKEHTKPKKPIIKSIKHRSSDDFDEMRKPGHSCYEYAIFKEKEKEAELVRWEKTLNYDFKRKKFKNAITESNSPVVANISITSVAIIVVLLVISLVGLIWIQDPSLINSVIQSIQQTTSDSNQSSDLNVTQSSLFRVDNTFPLSAKLRLAYTLNKPAQLVYLETKEGKKIQDLNCSSKGLCIIQENIPIRNFETISINQNKYSTKEDTILLCAKFNLIQSPQCITIELDPIQFISMEEPTINSNFFNCPTNYKILQGQCQIIKRCDDGTEYEYCSTNKPQFCENGNLINKASLCGCPFSDSIKNINENCVDLSKPNISELELEIHQHINAARQANGLKALEYDQKLADIARAHSQDMALNNFFEHENLRGQDPTARAKAAGYNTHKNLSGGWYSDGIAENIAQNNLYTSTEYINGIETSHAWQTTDEIAASIVNGWMNSPGHRANILNNDYDKEGIGVAISPTDEVLATEDFW